MAARLWPAVARLLPSACGRCSRPLPGAGGEAGVCRDCWTSVAIHTEPCCPRCGLPKVPEAETCLACRTAPPPWATATSAGPYAGTLRELILLLKLGRRDELAAPLARLAAAAWQRDDRPTLDLVVGVPTPWLRRLRRGFNQAELLGRAAAALLGRPHHDLLLRAGREHQLGRTRAARLSLPAAAFRSRGPARGRILLVDDVLTTGATVRGCTLALLAAGAEEVHVLTVARTPTPRSPR